MKKNSFNFHRYFNDFWGLHKRKPKAIHQQQNI